MVLTGVAVLVAIGFGVWAVKVHSDLDDQRAATQAAEEQAAAQAEAAAAVAAGVEEIAANNEIFVVSNEDVAQAESEVAAAEEAVARQTMRPPRPAMPCRRRRTKRPSCAPSSSKPERSVTWLGRSASRRESAREDRSALSRPSAGATPKAARSSRPSRALAPPRCPDRREPYARSSRHGTPSVPSRPSGSSRAGRGSLRSRLLAGLRGRLREFSLASTAPIHAGSVLPPLTPIAAREGVRRGAAKSTRRRNHD